MDSSSQSSMSTNAKAWDIKGNNTRLNAKGGAPADSQNTGKCDHCRYRTSKQDRILYDCQECGSYIVSTKSNSEIGPIVIKSSPIKSIFQTHLPLHKLHPEGQPGLLYLPLAKLNKGWMCFVPVVCPLVL